MARYFTDFSEYTAGTAPPDWTKRFYTSSTTCNIRNDALAIGGKELRMSATSGNYQRLFAWNDLDTDADRANCEILTKGRASYISEVSTVLTVWARSSGNYTAANGYYATLEDGDAFRIYKSVSNVCTVLAEVAFNHVENTWYWIRFRVNGSNLYAKVWQDGQNEPEAWTLTATSTSVSAAGWIGLYFESTTTTFDYDIFSVGTNGETALSVPTVTTNAATNIFATQTTLNANVSNTGGENVQLSFEYGTTTAYGNTVNAGTVGTGDFNAIATGLENNTLYHFRAKATNLVSTSYGADLTFTTPILYIASQLSPNNLRISTFQTNTFTWQKNEQAIQTHYELRYRLLNGDWLTTGPIASATCQHIFEANVFAIDKNYEWQVKSYDNANPTSYDWSGIVPFTTIFAPTPTEINPAAGSNVYTGINTMSARITSIYGRDCKMKVLIADNAGYLNPSIFQSGFYASGETIPLAIAYTKRGTNYIRLIAEDTEGMQTIIDYTLTAYQDIRFIEDPNIQIQGPQATHVCVRVQDSAPVVEYTAHTTPEPAVDKRIERLVLIDTGTAAVCQSVAEQLISRWGREQKSVSGKINMTVTLDFKEKIHIIIPTAAIDEEMILQQKEHDIMNMSTTITVGDILLDDSELLARILDELGK